jgi:hypothetical protein
MFCRICISCLLWLLLSTLPLSAEDLNDELNQQIDDLKTALLASNCTFERNGKTYTPQEALEHINKKHHYYADKIDSVERFIELSASKSMLSGQAYYMICGGERIKSADWLHDKSLLRVN